MRVCSNSRLRKIIGKIKQNKTPSISPKKNTRKYFYWRSPRKWQQAYPQRSIWMGYQYHKNHHHRSPFKLGSRDHSEILWWTVCTTRVKSHVPSSATTNKQTKPWISSITKDSIVKLPWGILPTRFFLEKEPCQSIQSNIKLNPHPASASQVLNYKHVPPYQLKSLFYCYWKAQYTIISWEDYAQVY